jgi:hypothetical protein
MKVYKWTFNETYYDYRCGRLEVRVPNDISQVTLDEMKDYFQQEGGYIRASRFKDKFPDVELIEARECESYNTEYCDSSIDEEIEDEGNDECKKQSHLPEWL